MRRWAEAAVALAVATALSGPATAQSGAAALLTRLDALEAEVRRLTAAQERESFARRQAEAEAAARIEELEFRIIELEGGDPLTAFSDPPAPAPAPAPAAPATAAPTQPTAAPAPTLRPEPGVLGALRVDDDGADGPAVGGDPAAAAFEAAMRDLDALGPDAGRRGAGAFLAEHPGHPLGGAAMLRVGDAFAAEGRLQDAARAYLQGVRDHPDAPEGPLNLLGLAEALAGLGRRDQACGAVAEFDARYPGGAGAPPARLAAARAAACG